MRSQQELKFEAKSKLTSKIKSHHMKHIIGILLYNSFIELLGSNQTFGEKQGFFTEGHFKQGEKNMLHNA